MPKATEPETPTEFLVEGKRYPVVDLDDLEFGEIELIEEAFGCAADDVDFRRAKAIRWLVFISMKRAGADVKFDDLGDLKFSAIEDAPEQPSNGAAKRPTKAKAAKRGPAAA